MSAVPVVFCTSDLPFAAAIRAVTWSRWSHVALVDEERREVVEAVWPAVRAVPLDKFLAERPNHVLARLPARDPKAVMAAARGELGKPYDLWGALGLSLHRDWQDPSAWWCSELAAYAFDKAASPLFRAESLNRVTPQHLWMLAPVLETA